MSRLTNKYQLCIDQADPFLEEKAFWYADLSNGLCVYQDDDRPGITEETTGLPSGHSAWVRLFYYMLEDPCTITAVHMRFRDHVVKLPYKDIDGYYFTRGLIGEWGSKDNLHYNIMGVIRDFYDGQMTRLWHHLPSLEVLQQDILTADKWSPPQIIWNLADKRLEYGKIQKSKVDL